MRTLDAEAARQAAYGGLVFGAGGGGLERGLRAGAMALEHGEPVLVGLDELQDDDQIVVTTGVGAPGVSRRLTRTADNLRALDRVIEAWTGEGRIVGTMIAHPGAWMPGTWFTNAIRPELAVVDCATNGRGHPTVAMGGMGLASRREVDVTQAASGGLADHLGHIEIVARGPLGVISSVLHHASAEVGASIAAARGPFSAAFCREHGAVGAVSACLRLGEAMIAAEGEGGEAMIAAILETLGGTELGRGPLLEAETRLVEAWDVGNLALDADGSRLEVVVCNEYMAVERDGERLSTYPDLIVTLSPEDGMPTAAARMERGQQIVVISVPQHAIPLGAGVWDEVVYRDPERLTGKELASYALAGAPSRR